MFVVFVVEKDEKGKNRNDNWNFWFWFFGSKNGRFVMHNCFSQICFLKPLFYSVCGVRAFWAKLSKKGKFWTPPKRKIE